MYDLENNRSISLGAFGTLVWVNTCRLVFLALSIMLAR